MLQLQTLPQQQPAVILRDYQEECIGAVNKAYDEGDRGVAVALPTGSGKTYTAAAFIVSFCHSTQYAAIIVPRIDLVNQAYKEFLNFFPADQLGIIQGDRNDLGRRVTIISKNTIEDPKRRLQFMNAIPGGVAVLFLDECHKGSIHNWHKIVDELLAPQGYLIGLSATLFRSDGQSLLQLFPNGIAYTKDFWELVDAGWLADVDAYHVPTDIPSNFEEEREKLGLSVERGNLYRYAKILAEWRAHAEGKRTLVFARDIDDAYDFEYYLTADGHTCAIVTGKTPIAKREEIYEAFRAGTILWLISVDVLTTGNDIKEIECILIMRNTETINLGLLIQMVGRGMRLCPAIGKTKMVLLNATSHQVTLMMFRQLFGTTNLRLPSLRVRIKEMKEEEQKAGELFEKDIHLDMVVRVSGTQFNPFVGDGWFFAERVQEWHKIWRMKGEKKDHTLVAKRCFEGGYLTYDITPDGEEIVVCDIMLNKFDARKACNQYAEEQKAGGVRGPDPRILDEPVSDADFAYLRHRRKIPMRAIGVPWVGGKMKEVDYERCKKSMKKRHYYEMTAFLDVAGSARSDVYGSISYHEGRGVYISRIGIKRPAPTVVESTIVESTAVEVV